MRRRGLACLLVMMSLATTAEAQDFSVGGGVGVVKPEDVDASPWLTGNVRFYPTPWMAVEPEIGYWSSTDRAQSCVPDLEVCFDAEARVEDLSVGANVLITRPTGRVRPWGGVGLGAHFLESEITLQFDQGGSTENTELGVHVLGGLDVHTSDRVAWFGAVR